LDLSNREFWALVHGILLGGAFLVAFTGGLAGFYSLRPELVTAEGITERIRRLSIGTTAMALLTWLTVIVGTWVVYPWYREDIPESPRSRLLANPDTEDWHEFAMEWKEHVAWIAPMLATAAFVVAAYYGRDLARNRPARRIGMTLFVAAFAVAAIAGILGALITKKAPVT
jgi:Na+/proline symporter